MHSPLAAVVLCIVANVASLPCLAADAKTDAQPVAVKAIKTSTAPVTASKAVTVATAGSAAAAQTRAGGELIKTAAAGTRDDAPPAAHDSARATPEDEHPRGGSTAMLLSARALMSAIALRRFAGPGR
jgi:hypothetical protein